MGAGGECQGYIAIKYSCQRNTNRVTAAAAASSSITISWNAVAGATGYKVYYATSPSSSATRHLAGTVTGTSCTHTHLSIGTTYYYYITAVNSAGESAMPSTYASATVFRYTVTYNANGGSGTPPASQGVTLHGGSITITGKSGLVYSGHVFTGWNTDSGGTGTPLFAGDPVIVLSDITLYAQWAVAMPLTDSTWTPNTLATFAPHYYTFTVTSGSIYYISWDDGYGTKSGTYTGNVYVSAYNQDDTPIFTSADNAYSTPKVFTASQSGTITIKVVDSGSYGLKYYQ